MLLIAVGALVHYGLYYLALRLGLKGMYWVRFLKWAGLGLIWTFGLLCLLSTISAFIWGWSELYSGVFLLCVAAIGWPVWRAYRRFTRPEPEERPLHN